MTGPWRDHRNLSLTWRVEQRSMGRRFSMLTRDLIKGSAAALSIKFSSAVLGFTMFALLSRHMDRATFGALAIVFNAASFFAIVSLCGQEILIVRSWNEYCDGGRPEL